jgi:hypothetical protein
MASGDRNNELVKDLEGSRSFPIEVRKGADKSLVFFLFPIFLFAAQPKEIFLDVLKKLEQRSHKCVELGGGGGGNMYIKYIFSNS